jgi:hypothetical protein
MNLQKKEKGRGRGWSIGRVLYIHGQTNIFFDLCMQIYGYLCGYVNKNHYICSVKGTKGANALPNPFSF